MLFRTGDASDLAVHVFGTAAFEDGPAFLMGLNQTELRLYIRERKSQTRHRRLSPFLTLSRNRGGVLKGKGDAPASGPPG
ncbi:MAG: hypothetical protein ABF917_02325, partial [Gluconobacter oxydans]